MQLNEAELAFIDWYRNLSDKEKLSVRRYVHLNDSTLLPAAGEFRERLDGFRRLTMAQRPDEGAFFGT